MHAALVFILLLAVATACYTGFAYHLPARDARAAELIVRYSDVQIFAARAGLTVEEALLFLRERGITSIGVAEYTLWQLRKEPGSYVLSSLELAGELALNPELSPYRSFLETKVREAGFSFGDYLVFMPAGPWAEQVGEHLHNLYTLEGDDYFRLTAHRTGEMVLYLLQGVNYDHLPQLSLGAKPARLEEVAAAGLLISPYLSPRTVETPATAAQMLAAYEPYPLSAAVFEGGVVPGYPATLPELAAALQARGIPAALYEYHRFPKGMPELAPLLDYKLMVMRDGSINDDPQAVVNGLRERRVQLLELDLRGLAARSSGAELQEKTAARLAKLAAALRENGYTPGRAVPLRPFQGHFLLYITMAAGIISLALFLLQFFLPLRPVVLTGLFALGLAAATLLLHTRFLLAQQALALLAALLFPFYGALYLLTRPLAGGAPGFAGKSFLNARLLRHCLQQVFILFLFSLAGGLLVHGLLTTPPFFHGLEFFRGVKIMYILPLSLAGLTALVLAAGFNSRETLLGGGRVPLQFQPGSRDHLQPQAHHQPHHQPQARSPVDPQFRILTQARFDTAGGSISPDEPGESIISPPYPGAGAADIPGVSHPHRDHAFARAGSLFPLQFPAEQRQLFFATLRRLLRRQLTWGDLLFCGLLLFGAFIYLTRTGHVQSIIPLESTLRSTLERVFGARPRFKEFALGYPLALIGLYLSAGLAGVFNKGGTGGTGATGSLTAGRALRYLAFGTLCGGVLAPISVVNTFAHTLAPVGLSLLRSFHGFWLGLAIGLLLLCCLRCLRRPGG